MKSNISTGVIFRDEETARSDYTQRWFYDARIVIAFMWGKLKDRLQYGLKNINELFLPGNVRSLYWQSTIKKLAMR